MALQLECDCCGESVVAESLITIEHTNENLCSLCINDMINDLAYRLQKAEALGESR